MKNTFDGFHQDTLKFLAELKENNNKEWFDANRKFYDKEVKEKLKNFVFEMGVYFTQNQTSFVADPKISLFRINKDIRFSKNKDPYKTNLGIYFPFTHNIATAKKSTPLGMYCHLEPDNCFIATGYYMPEPAELKHFRTCIYYNYDEFLRTIGNSEFKKNYPDFLKMSEPLKNVPAGFEKTHLSAEYLKYKDLSYFCNIDSNIISTSDFLDLVKLKSEIATPFLTFFDVE